MQMVQEEIFLDKLAYLQGTITIVSLVTLSLPIYKVPTILEALHLVLMPWLVLTPMVLILLELPLKVVMID